MLYMLNFSKAFDMVCHRILLAIWLKYGVYEWTIR